MDLCACHGEIQSKTEVIAGATVRAGQKIASVGIRSEFTCLAICCTLNWTRRACRVLLLWRVILAEP